MLRQLSQETGGRAFFPTDARELAEDLPGDLGRALEPVHARLYVEESRSGTARGAGFRSASRSPNLTARTKQGYFGPTGSDVGRSAHEPLTVAP